LSVSQFYRDAAEALAARAEALADALERTERNLLLSIRGLPVRDLAENLAENAHVLNREQTDD
jgi:hypothetical protein